MTAAFEIQSACECQALLVAELDAQRQVLRGFASRAGDSASSPCGARRELAPANSVGAAGERFDVVWQCPLCGRNTLRSFHAAALRRIESRDTASSGPASSGTKTATE